MIALISNPTRSVGNRLDWVGSLGWNHSLGLIKKFGFHSTIETHYLINNNNEVLVLKFLESWILNKLPKLKYIYVLNYKEKQTKELANIELNETIKNKPN